MKARTVAFLALLSIPFSIANAAFAQEVLRLYPNAAPGSEEWSHQEQQYHSQIFNTEVVTNVADPTLIVYLPEKSERTGTSVIVAPGGGFHALSINSEGIDVAKWLVERGVAAFVLKYRLVPTEKEAVQEMMSKSSEPGRMEKDFAMIRPLAIADGQAAVRLVRSKASEMGLSPERVGLMGFSAGGAVAVGVVFADDPTSQPDFVAPIYPGAANFDPAALPADAPPIFLVAATNDQLDLAKDSVKLYSAWLKAGKVAELHVYSKGGHGFGMRVQGLPTDRWIERFGDFLDVEKLLEH
jgi:acetyl esterase/lipase